MKDTLRPGITHTKTYVVPADKTVPHLYPEASQFQSMPDVFATGFMVGLLEWACIEALASHLDEGEMTLGSHVDVSHLAPTVVGSTVVVDVTLTNVDGRALTFDVTARDDFAVITSGTHKRGVVLAEKFVSRLPKRS